MEKIIDFRAYHKPTNTMYYDIIHHSDFVKILDAYNRGDKDTEWELMRATGIRDWLGEMIYEGDIVLEKWGWGKPGKAPKRRPFVWIQGVVEYHDEKHPRWVVSHSQNNDHFWNVVSHKYIYSSTDEWYRSCSWFNECRIIGDVHQRIRALNADLNSYAENPAYWVWVKTNPSGQEWPITPPMPLNACEAYVFHEERATSLGYAWSLYTYRLPVTFEIREYKYKLEKEDDN